MKQKIIFTLVVLFSPAYQVLAQTLENIPGQTPMADSSDLVGYLNNIYAFGISITGILAIFMIGLGAFTYIVTSAGNSSKMLNAKEIIQNALIGLVIVLAAYLFLHVINPDLVSGTLKAPSDAVDKIVAPFIVMPGADGEECKSLVGFIVVHPSAPPCSECQNGFDPATAICGPPAI